MPCRTAAVLAGAAVLTATVAVPAVAVPAAARPWPRPAVPHAQPDRLVITVSGAGSGGTLSGTGSGPGTATGGTAPDLRTYTLDCRPAGGSHPDAPAACDAVDRAVRGPRSPWEPVPEGAMCAQVYGGPATARVTGVWRGARVNARFARTDGCEIARWDALVPALPGPGA